MKYKAEIARAVAEGLAKLLQPGCRRIEIAGSLRRKKEEVGDIELLCIPKFEEASVDLAGRAHLINCLDRELKKWIKFGVLDYRLNKKGNTTYGQENKLLVHVSSGIPVDIFSTDEEWWWVALVVRTGPKENNMRISRAASEICLRFPCHSEREVFEKLGLPYLAPERR